MTAEEKEVALDEFLTKEEAATEKEAEVLSGEFGDWHEAMIASGEGRKFKGYAEHAQVLADYIKKSGALYTYVLYSKSHKKDFYVTVDGDLEEPEDYKTPYDYLDIYKDAYDGITSRDDQAWNEDDDDACWSTVAPIRNSGGKVVAVLVVDSLVAKYMTPDPDAETETEVAE
jgi:hypothetical protein